MLCESLKNKSLYESWIFFGELSHVVSHSEDAFNEVSRIIEEARKKGVLDNVKILPNDFNSDQNKIEY